MSSRTDSPTQTIVFRGVNAVELADLKLKARVGAKESELQLGLAEAVVGSDPTCDLVLDDPAVSRRHCAVRRDELGVRVRDLGSKNGMKLGDARVLEAWLDPGRMLQLGASKVWLEQGDKPTELALAATNRFGNVYGASVAMRALFAVLERAAASDTTVLLLGETGTGKDAIASALHERGARREAPFIVCDCGALSASVVEAELFGHTRGAFSGAAQAREGLFQAANGGTLFLDEIGELPLELQPKLLRVLETRTVRPLGATQEVPVDVRVIAATHKDLRAAVSKRTFREDLFFRLSIIEVRVPPLRDRRDDIPLLVEQLLARREPKLTLGDLPPNALPLLTAYGWPGNVRELRNVVERLTLTNALDGLAAASEAVRPWHEARAEAIARFEEDHLRRALLLSQGNLAGAARLLGVSRQLVHQMVSRHGLEPRND